MSAITQRKKEGFFLTGWLNGSWSTHAWNLREGRFVGGMSPSWDTSLCACPCVHACARHTGKPLTKYPVLLVSLTTWNHVHACHSDLV